MQIFLCHLQAAMQVLAELSDKGIENDPQSPDSPKENHEIAPDSK